MSLPACVIIMIMSRSDLDATCAELAIYHLIGNDNDPPLRNEGMNDFLSYQILEARVFRMHSNGSISKHGLNSSRSNLDEFCGIVLKRVLEANNDSELYLLLVTWHLQHCSFLDVDVLDFNIRDGCF